MEVFSARAHRIKVAVEPSTRVITASTTVRPSVLSRRLASPKWALWVTPPTSGKEQEAGRMVPPAEVLHLDQYPRRSARCVGYLSSCSLVQPGTRLRGPARRHTVTVSTHRSVVWSGESYNRTLPIALDVSPTVRPLRHDTVAPHAVACHFRREERNSLNATIRNRGDRCTCGRRWPPVEAQSTHSGPIRGPLRETDGPRRPAQRVDTDLLEQPSKGRCSLRSSLPSRISHGLAERSARSLCVLSASSVNENVAPSPGSESTQISPP